MHDIGSSRPGGWGAGYHEFEQELAGEMSGEFEQEQEFAGEFEQELVNGGGGTATPGGLSGLGGQGEYEYENEYESEVSGEMQELELAAELLSVNNEQEMEQFLGGLIKSVGRVATNFAKSSAGKALGGILRSAAKAALPVVGSALGNLVVPGAGGVIGGKLAGMAGSALGLELEGLSNEDREFEVARRLVRIGQHAATHLATVPRHIPPARAARIAFLRGARQVAPGLLPAMRAISQNGVAAARQMGMPPIFGAPGTTPHPGSPGPAMPAMPAMPAIHAGPSSAGLPAHLAQGTPSHAVAPYATSCPSCGGSVPALHGGLPHAGHWRRSRNGRAIIVYLSPPRSAY